MNNECIHDFVPAVPNYAVMSIGGICLKCQMTHADYRSLKEEERKIWITFAAAALNGMVAWVVSKNIDPTREEQPSNMAVGASHLADAMLEQLRKRSLEGK